MEKFLFNFRFSFPSRAKLIIMENLIFKCVYFFIVHKWAIDQGIPGKMILWFNPQEILLID